MSDDLLYQLLPAIYRTRDIAQGQPLRALLGVVQQQYDRLHENLDDLYDAWFVETCDEWMLPYLGERVGVHGLNDPRRMFSTTRAQVANAVGRARARGTAPALAGAVRDATGWPARVLEGWQRLGWTQNVDDVRPGRGGTLALSPGVRPAAVGTGFDDAARTVDLRRPGPPREADVAGDDGRSGLARVAVFLWRLRSYPVTQADACPVGPGRWTFHPAGVDSPLFHPPGPEPAPGRQPTLAAVPAPLTREVLRDELEAGLPVPPSGWPMLTVQEDGVLVSPGRIIVTDLSRWTEPPRGRVAVDPLTGRLAFPAAERPSRVLVWWAYGLPGALGGGSYSRAGILTPPGSVQWAAWVGHDAPPGWLQLDTLHEALEQWAGQPAAIQGLIRLAGSGRHGGDGLNVEMASAQALTIEAADGDWPCLVPTLSVTAHGGGALTLNGLLLAGGVTIQGTPALAISHCTVRGGIRIRLGGFDAVNTPANTTVPRVTVSVDRSFTGPIYLPGGATGLRVTDSVVHGDEWALASTMQGGSGPTTTLIGCTILGRVSAAHLRARDTVFRDPVDVADDDVGELDCCDLPRESCGPRCQLHCTHHAPVFTSTHYGQPGYAQLATATPSTIREGARDGSEMGVYCRLRNPQREANLRETLDAHLPVGLQAAILYAT